MRERSVALRQKAANFPALTLEDFLLRAHARRSAKDLDGALADLDYLAKREQPNASVLALRAVVLYEREDPAGALAAYDEALALQPENQSLLFQRGLLNVARRRNANPTAGQTTTA